MKTVYLDELKYNDMGKIKPSINPKGYRTSIREYSEVSIIEEIAANSYDAYASTFLLLLDDVNNKLYMYDDGIGFNNNAMKDMFTLGGGKKEELFAKSGTRVYLGSFGFGFKAIIAIANEITFISCSKEDNKKYTTKCDFSEFDKMMEQNEEGYDYGEEDRDNQNSHGTIIILDLKKPTSKNELDQYIKNLTRLPNDNGKFNCYSGFLALVKNEVLPFHSDFTGLSEICKKLQENDKIDIVSNLLDSELSDCDPYIVTDKENNASGTIFFAGMQGDKPRNLKDSLRGVFVRINGRLLKSNFSNDEYTGGITKYIQFKSGMRCELNIDWLRSEISLSRTGIKFNNPQLEVLFKKTVGRLVSKFTVPEYAKLAKVKEKAGDKKFKQRLELAKKRRSKTADVVIKQVRNGFNFKPESDAEVAILIAQEQVMKLINPSYKLIDYNDKEGFDCMLWDESRDEPIYTELEPTLIEFLEHKRKNNIQLIIVWTLGKWRVGATMKAREGWFKLNQQDINIKGNYRLVLYPGEESTKAKLSIPVIVLEEILK